MNNSDSPNTQNPISAGLKNIGAMLFEGLKGKRISYLTIPLLAMATVTEFVILATGWNYQRAVCVPPGMGVTFFGIGPIGATILAVELLKLPLAIWTASRTGWQKAMMVALGLPLICLLTFQLVKDMAVYEMGVAMTPASQFLDKAATEEVKIAQLKGDLAAIVGKKSDREQKLADLDAQKTKAKAELEESLKRNDVMRQDAISLTDYQQKSLSEVEARQAAIVRQFNNDTVPLTKALTDLRARREAEFPRAAAWNAEQARIDNAFNAKTAEYNTKKAAYEKDKVEYAKAGFLKRHLMGEPVDPGAAPEREINKIVKPTLIGELDAQIAAKEAELTAVNNQRRTRIAEVSDDAQRVRQEFDKRSTTKREEIDKKREELLAAQAALEAKWQADRKEIDQEYGTAAKNVDGLRAEIDTHTKTAEGYYEAREAAIKNTQVHRIATTVEIIRGLLFGKHPVSITASAKERGDIYTDQVSMVRIWVYPVLAFIVSFLPTLMVEIGFSTLFHQEEKRRPFRFGFLGQNLHWLYKRAGSQKIARAERLAREAAAAKAATEKTLQEKEAALLAAQQVIATASDKQAWQLKQRQEEWDNKFAALSDSLNQALMEKDALRDFQQLEIERQVQQRQTVWSERLAKLREELEAQHTANEAERTAMAQEQNKQLLQMAEECKAQVVQVRREMADAAVAAEETSAKLALELKEALNAREEANAQLEKQAESYETQLKRTRQEATSESERAARQEKNRLEAQQLEFTNTLRQREQEFERRMKKREQELILAFEARYAEQQVKTDQEVRGHTERFERHVETRVEEVEALWTEKARQQEDTAQLKLRTREQQLQAQADARVVDVQAQAAEVLRRRELEFARQLDTQSREANKQLQQELQQKELEFQAKLKQREQELTSRSAAWENELKNQWAVDLRNREEEWAQKAEARLREAEARLAKDVEQKEEVFQSRLRQREQELAAKLNTQAEAAQTAEREWASELDLARSTIESFKAALARTENERDEARMTASDGVRQLQDLKKKSMEASSLLNSWANGNHEIAVNG